MRVAVIGLGGIANRAYLPVLGSRGDLELLLCSRAAASVELARARHRVAHGCTGIEELLAWVPQAAFVLTPTPTHRELARTLLENGVDVFLEKPATPTSGETRALAELADARGRILMVGFNRRFAPLHRAARELWGDRPVSLCVAQKHRQGAAHPDLLANYLEDTVHVIDALRFFCGEGEPVSSVQRLRHERLTAAMSVVALQSGGHALVATCLDAGAWRETYALHGEGVTLELEAFSTLRWREGSSERVWREDYAGGWRPMLEARGFPEQIAHFLECVALRRPPLTSAWEAWRTQLLLEEMAAAIARSV